MIQFFAEILIKLTHILPNNLRKSTRVRESIVPAQKFATISVLNNSTVVGDDDVKSAKAFILIIAISDS